MEHLILYSVACIMIGAIQSIPVYDQFSKKYIPFSQKQTNRPNNFGMMFGKMQTEAPMFRVDGEIDILKKLFFRDAELRNTHQSHEDNKQQSILSLGPKKYNIMGTQPQSHVNFINLPLIRQPYTDYKILVATAPSSMSMGFGAEKRKVVVYIVFPDDGEPISDTEKIPRIYFVNENSINSHLPKNVDPIFIIDSNRTVTGLKSKAVPKFLQFRKKIKDPFYYEIIP